MRHLLERILSVLCDISHKLDTIISNNDFSQEDALVQAMTKEVKDALGHLPQPTTPPRKNP